MTKPLSPILHFETALAERLAQGGYPSDAPLPTTRQLAGEHGLSNASVHRVLRKLAESGALWRHENGRYYPAAARELLDKPRPLACLLRQLQHWAFAYQGIMAGVSEACGRSHRSMILTHNEVLVRHRDTAQPPTFGSAEMQRAALAQFLEIHPEPLHGFVLDHLWRDEVIARFRRELSRVVVVNRPTSLPFASAVYPDFRLGATLALGHLAVRGYERIVPVLPFEGDPFTARFLDEFFLAAGRMGLSLGPDDLIPAATEADRTALLQSLTGERVALFCPESNVAALLLHGLRERALEGRVGLLSVGDAMSAGMHGMTTLVVPFQEIGAEAVALLDRPDAGPVERVLPLELFLGATTSSQ